MKEIVENSVDGAELMIPRTKVSVVDPLADPDWDHAVEKHPEATLFHSSAWCRVLAKTYGHHPLYLRLDQDDRPAALIPLMEVRSMLTGTRGVALPFSDFCDALHFDSATEPGVFAAIERLARERRWNHVEIRGAGGVSPAARPAVSFYAHKLDLQGGHEEIHRRFRSSVQRALRKPRASDLSVGVFRSETAMRKFYRLHAITRGRHGLPPQPLAFFLNIHKEIIERGMGDIVLVELAGRPIAAMVFFHWGNVGIYKFGASDKAFQHLRPNNLAMWEGIRMLSTQGFKTLHFGRSSLGNEGLRRFKLGWGATEEMLHYYRYDAKRATWGTTRDRSEGLHTAFFKLLPPALNRLAGKLLYAHLD